MGERTPPGSAPGECVCVCVCKCAVFTCMSMQLLLHETWDRTWLGHTGTLDVPSLGATSDGPAEHQDPRTTSCAVNTHSQLPLWICAKVGPASHEALQPLHLCMHKSSVLCACVETQRTQVATCDASSDDSATQRSRTQRLTMRPAQN